MSNPQTRSHLYGFDGSEMCSLGTIALPIHADCITTHGVLCDYVEFPQQCNPWEAMDPYNEGHPV